MTDQEQLQEAIAAFDRAHPVDHSKPKTLWDLVRRVHASPVLAEWVTLESEVLTPLFERAEPGARWGATLVVHALLATRSQSPGRMTPWGYVAWSWPSGRPLAMLELGGPFLAGDMPSLSVADRCTPEICHAAERALGSGDQMPSVSAELLTCYAPILRALASRSTPDGTQRASEPESQVAEEGTNAASPPRRPPPVRELLGALSSSRALLEACGYGELQREWHRIRAWMNAPQFTVVVAGEFSRGKSTFVNSLLADELLPVGDLPTTAMVVRISDGPEERFVRVDRERRRETLSREDLDALVADDDGVDPEGMLHLELPNSWLKASGIQLVDTPGAGDLSGTRAELATAAIASSDATLVAVSATMAMSLTERMFVEQNVLTRAVPKVAVVVTRLDQVSQADRARVLAHVREQVAELAPGAEVWSAHGAHVLPSTVTDMVAGPDAIRRRLTAWAKDASEVDSRIVQVGEQLLSVLDGAGEALAAECDIVRSYLAGERDAAAAAASALSRAQLGWGDLELEFGRREFAVSDWVDQELRGQHGRISDELGYELSRHPAPGTWWEKDLPYRFNRAVTQHLSHLEKQLQQRIATDANWLRTSVREQFDRQLGLERPGAVVEAPAEAPDLVDAGFNMGTAQKAGRIGSLLVGVVAAALFSFPPAAILVGGIAGLLSESFTKRKVEDQRERLCKELETVLTTALKEVGDATKVRIAGIYREIMAETKKQEQLWRSSREQAISRASTVDDNQELLAKLEARTAELQSLKAQLIKVMEG
ncbi:MAG: dynamin family protein [Sandaracinaceae bacterium]|nr:dynamin family protein [Sandaracinaceae bacterium]